MPVAGVPDDRLDRRVEVSEDLERAVRDPVAARARAEQRLHERSVETPSSLRLMPTVTVFAWCLIASIGRVSSSIARVSAAVRSSISTLGVAILPESRWYSSSGTSLSASRRIDVSRNAVDASSWPS
jgi:hypothetical protein